MFKISGIMMLILFSALIGAIVGFIISLVAVFIYRKVPKNQNEKYGAYITFADTKFDKICAYFLYVMIILYHVPRNIKRRHLRLNKRIYLEKSDVVKADIFREDEKAPLQNSEYLIVICSLFTKASERIRQQVELVKESGGNNQVLLLLVQGKPEEAFPEQLYTRISGASEEPSESQHEESQVEIEPLAANITASNIFKSLLKLRTEKFMILARLIGCSLDELEQRYLKRKRIYYTILSSIVLTACLVLSISFIMNQHDVLKKQNELKMKDEYMMSQLDFYLSEMPLELNKNPELHDKVNNIVCDLLDDMEYSLYEYVDVKKLKLDEVLKPCQSDTVENVIIKARTYKMQGKYGLAKELIQKIPELSKQDFNGDLTKFVNCATRFYQEVPKQKLKEGLYITKILQEGKLINNGFCEGDIIIGYKEPRQKRYTYTTYPERWIIGYDKYTNVLILRLEKSKLVRKEIKINSVAFHEETGLVFYVI